MDDGDWNQIIGHDSMNHLSQSFCIGWSHKTFYSWGQGQQSKWTAAHEFQQGDHFKLRFDFLNDQLSIFFQDIEAQTVSLNNRKTVIPALSLRGTDLGQDEIQIVSYKLELK